jgi:N-acetylglucosamine kinase-like BadF-type ATPase
VKYFLGLDGGGTKTDAALIDASGRVVAQARGGPSNPLRSSFARAFTSLDDAAARAMAAADLEASSIQGVVAGLAGASQPRVSSRVATFLSTRFREARIEAIADLEIALEAVAESGPAAVLISGTGSAAFARDAAGNTARAGGWGPWFGDEGSAFAIARSALQAIARAHDTGAVPSTFAQAIASSLGLKTWPEVFDYVSRKPLERMPAVFPAVAEAADAGNSVAREILDGAAKDLAALASTVITRLGLGGEEFLLGRVGGVVGRCSFFDERCAARFAELSPCLRVVAPRFSPAVAAAHRALRHAPDTAG